MFDSYASHRLVIHSDTQQKNDEPAVLSKQHIEIPASWLGIRGGSYRKAVRAVTVIGTVEVEKYGRRRVDYGKCNYNGWVVAVIRDGNLWQAVEYKEKGGENDGRSRKD